MDKLTALIAKHEGLRLKPYKDTVGKLTIGYGRNLDDVGISQDIADQMLTEDVAQSIKACRKFKWFEDLNEIRQAVIVNMVFNLGITRFRKFKKTIAHIKRRHYCYASDEMLDSKWARQVKGRAEELAHMMCTGQW